MMLLDLSELFKQVFELRVVGVGGVAAVFVHAQLLLILEILEQAGFFLRWLHSDHLTGSMPGCACAHTPAGKIQWRAREKSGIMN